MPVLVMACEFSHRVTHPKIPKLNRIVCTPSQESVKGISIDKGTLVKLDRVRVALVSIINGTYCLVSICIVYNQLFIRTPNDANR